jgi:hypothetical protein
MLRVLALSMSLLAAAPAPAWEARVGTICELVHAEEDGDVRVTYDPRGPEYAITIRRSTGAWPTGPVFVIRFDGGRPITIQTDRHALSEGGAALTVTDRGFGNVLDGLQYNETATAYLGDVALPFALTGPEPAAPAVEEFRRCTEGGLA